MKRRNSDNPSDAWLLLLIPILLAIAMMAGCAGGNGIITLAAGTSTATISAPMPWWGEPAGYVSLDTPTTHTQAAYGVSKKGDVALGMAAIGTFGGGATAGLPGAIVGGGGGALLGNWLDTTTTDSLNSIAAQALAARSRRGLGGMPLQ